MSKVQQIQTILGVKADDIWGPKSQAALIAADEAKKRQAQQVLGGLTVDGAWGPKSQAALNAVASDHLMSSHASSFADPADIAAFKRCKATGKTDLKCFAIGDNGIGQFGAITSQEQTPMVAVHKTDMIARWGSINAAAHRKVVVIANGESVTATVEDRISSPGRIDLNPAAAKSLGLKPPFVVPCQWGWA